MHQAYRDFMGGWDGVGCNHFLQSQHEEPQPVVVQAELGFTEGWDDAESRSRGQKRAINREKRGSDGAQCL